MNSFIKLVSFGALLFTAGVIAQLESQQVNNEHMKGQHFVAHHTSTPINIDGNMDEVSWEKAKWSPLFEDMIGQTFTPEDFSGQFKLLWDKNYLYLVAEITDDVLFDQHADPLYFYWDDDCLEIFIDEDGSGGNHQFNYNAFAYHVALDNQAVDIGEQTPSNKEPFLTLNDHITSVWKRDSNSPNKIIWEVAIKIYDDSFKPDSGSQPLELTAGKIMGFMLAYCDNDGSKNRENFIGSTSVEALNGDKNRGYIDASVFAQLTLIK